MSVVLIPPTSKENENNVQKRYSRRMHRGEAKLLRV